MLITYLSDLHLEFVKNVVPDHSWAQADVCILAGDIITANYLNINKTDNLSIKFQDKFKNLISQVSKYKHVFWVAGNHEHYNSKYSETIPLMREFAQKFSSNIKVFEDESFEVDDTLFVGSTFWTNMNNSNPIIMYNIQHMMNDYFVIYHNKLMKTAITPDLTVNTHTNSLKFIDSTIKDHKKVVVFTHHPATLQSLNKLHAGNNLDPAYASDYEKWVNERPQIKAWISGHIHMKMNIQVDNCRYVSNSKGYYHEKSSKIFKPNTIIEI